jgi:hypothetical protein
MLYIVLTGPSFLFSQDQPGGPYVVSSAYADKTPPLREMKIILPGERDRSWKDDIIGNKSFKEEIKNQRADIPDDFTDPVLQKEYDGGRDIQGPIRNFDGVGNVNGVYPPDTDGDVGPDHYFQMINLSFAIWDKSGNLLYGPVDNSTLWNGFIGPWTGTNDGDPIVLYDEQADRWMASQFAINTSNGTYWQLVAVSATPDPLGAYYRYAFQFPAFNDYPKLSVWTDGYYATFNLFGGYTRVGVAAFERDSMLAGAESARMVFFNQPSGTFSMLPADFDGTPPPEGTPCYFAHLRTFSTQKLEIYEFDVNWDNPSSSTYTLVQELQPASFNPNINSIPQPNTGTLLDALNMMLMYRLQYRNFGTYQTLVTNHTVNAGGRAGVRWYELRKSDDDWSIYQQGTYSPDSENRWMASVAMAGNGNMAIGFSKSSSTTYPSIFYTGRNADAPMGEMNFPEIMITGGTTSQSGIDRWGDYSSLSIDPTDDTTFWFTTEYMGNGWKTRIASFDFGPILPPSVDAGNDTLICETEPFLTAATAAYQQSILWESSGDGFFLDPTKVNAIYLRGQGDLAAGQVQLKVTAMGYLEGTSVQDSMLINLSRIAIAYAGPDTTICADDVILLNGTVTYSDSIRWISEGDGTFDNDSILDPVYTPGPADISKGYAWLHLKAYDTIPCETFDNDKMKVTIDQCTDISEDDRPTTVFRVLPNPTTGILTIEVSGMLSKGAAMVVLLNSQGQQLFGIQLDSADDIYLNQLDISKYPKGVYYMKLQLGEEQFLRKVLLQ